MEALHNLIAAMIVRYISAKKVTVAEAILVLDIIKLDLVKQVSAKVYTKSPVALSTKKPSVIGKKDGVHKDNPRK